MIRRLCPLLMLVLLLSCPGCSSWVPRPPVPDPTGEDSGALVLSLKMRARPRAFSYSPDVVFFVRATSSAALSERDIYSVDLVPSTCVYDAEAYLMNAEPGWYAPVAATMTTVHDRDEGDGEPPVFGVLSLGSAQVGNVKLEIGLDIDALLTDLWDSGKRATYSLGGTEISRYYFPQEAIETLWTEVKPGTIASMGKCVMDIHHYGEGGKAEDFFKRVLEGEGGERSGFAKWLTGEWTWRLTEHELARGADADREVTAKALEFLEETGWAAHARAAATAP